MKKQLLILLITISSVNCYSQISFEKGYYINNSGQKIDCLIKNNDWKNNPTKFEYKLSLESNESRKETIKGVKEFGIYNTSKYVRSVVNMDRSSDKINNISYDKNPIFKKEELFLKVLIEGKSNLYIYVEGALRRYFYNKENFEIEQLVYKSYKTPENYINKNNKFRQQLWNNLKCPKIGINKIKTIDYTKKDLIMFFTLYNNCFTTELINFEKKEKRDFFNLTLRPRINSSSLTMTENLGATSEKTDYGTKTGAGFGIEAEFILPFNKGKWSVLVEPTYQYFKYKESTEKTNVLGGELTEEINYSSIEIPISLRHYFFLSKNSKIFINASLVTDFSFGSSVKFTRNDGSTLNSLEIAAGNNFAIGFGYKHKNKYSFEIRYQSSRDILRKYSFLKSDYKTLSIIFGYSIL